MPEDGGLTTAARIFNTGCPWNVPAGQGGANLNKLIAHYEQENFAENERKMQALKEGTAGASKARPVVKSAPNP